jgi:hypothetical protein
MHLQGTGSLYRTICQNSLFVYYLSRPLSYRLGKAICRTYVKTLNNSGFAPLPIMTGEFDEP